MDSKYGCRLRRSGVMATTSDGWCCPRFIIQLHTAHQINQHHSANSVSYPQWDGKRVVLLVKFIKHNQNCYLKLDVSTSIRGLCQKKMVLISSGSRHDGKTPCQESSHILAMNRDEGSYQLSQLSLLPSVGREKSSSFSTVGYGVKA